MRKLSCLLVLVLLGFAGYFGIRAWIAHVNKVDMEIAAFNRIQDPIARAAAYQSEPAAAKKEVRQNPKDLGAQLAMVRIDTAKNDYAGAAHHLRLVIRLQPQKREYQYLLCGCLLKMGRTKEAAHRLEDLTLTKDTWGDLGRKELDTILPADKK